MIHFFPFLNLSFNNALILKYKFDIDFKSKIKFLFKEKAFKSA